MDSNYQDIVRQHLENSYFAELFFRVKQYYNTKPLQPYREPKCLSTDYRLLKEHPSYFKHYRDNIKSLFTRLIQILKHILFSLFSFLESALEALDLSDEGCGCTLPGILLFVIIISCIAPIVNAYWNHVRNKVYFIITLIPLMIILLVLIIALFTSLFSYHRDKKMVAEYNEDIKLQNQKIYEKSLGDCFSYHFKHHIALDSQNYIHNVVKQIDNNYQLFLKRALQNKSHSSFEDQCLKFVSSYFKYDVNQSSVCVLLFSRIYQILSENEVSSFDEVEKIYNLYEEKGIFQSIKSVLYQRKYYPEYYPIIEYRILMEREFIISAIDNQKGFVENPSNLVLNKYKSLASE